MTFLTLWHFENLALLWVNSPIASSVIQNRKGRPASGLLLCIGFPNGFSVQFYNKSATPLVDECKRQFQSLVMRSLCLFIRIMNFIIRFADTKQLHLLFSRKSIISTLIVEYHHVFIQNLLMQHYGR